MSRPDGGQIRSLILRTRAGERDAYGEIVRHFERRLFGLAAVMTRDAAASEDLVQDAFIRAYTRLDTFDASRELYPWLATILTRLCQNWLARRARKLAREGGDPPESLSDAAASGPLSRLIDDESRRRLWDSVATLPAGERTAVYMSYRQGLSVAEIARALGVTAGTVKTWLFRARRKLRRQMQIDALRPEDSK